MFNKNWPLHWVTTWPSALDKDSGEPLWEGLGEAQVSDIDITGRSNNWGENAFTFALALQISQLIRTVVFHSEKEDWVTASVCAGTSQSRPGARTGNTCVVGLRLNRCLSSDSTCESEETFVKLPHTHTGNLCQLNSWTGTWKSWRRKYQLSMVTSQTSEAWLISKWLGISAN